MGCGGSKSTTSVVVPNHNNKQHCTQAAGEKPPVAVTNNNNNQESGQPSNEAPIDNPNQHQQQPQVKQPAAATRIIKKVRIKETNELEFFDILSYEEAAKQVN